MFPQGWLASGPIRFSPEHGDRPTDRGAWPHIRWEIPHNWYQDRAYRAPIFSTAMSTHSLQHRPAFGWTAGIADRRLARMVGLPLGFGGVRLDVIDPILKEPDFLHSVEDSLRAVGVADRVNLVPAQSPIVVERIANRKIGDGRSSLSTEITMALPRYSTPRSVPSTPRLMQ